MTTSELKVCASLKIGQLQHTSSAEDLWADCGSLFACRCLQLFWPRQLVRKWLQFKPTGDDFNADNIEHESIMAEEEEEEVEDRERQNSRLTDSLPALTIVEEPQPQKKPPRHLHRHESGKFQSANVRPLIRGQSETLRKQYVDTKEYRIAVGTWNVAGKPPPDELDLEEWLDSCQEADIYVLGFQEIVPLNAGNVLCVEDEGPAAKWEKLIRDSLNNRCSTYRGKSQSAPHSPWKDLCIAGIPEIDIEAIIEGVASEDQICSLVESDAPASVVARRSPVKEQKEDAGSNKHRSKKQYRITQDVRLTPERRFSADGLERLYSSDDRRLVEGRLSGQIGLPSDLRRMSSDEGLSSATFSSDGNLYDWSFKDSIPGPGEGFHSFLDQEESLQTPLFPPAESESQHFCESERMKARYSRVASKQMVGIFISVWVRSELRRYVHNVKVSCVGCGLMGYLGNKGSISVSMSLHQTSFCFTCSHLTSGHREGDEQRRNQDVAEILRRTVFPRSSKMLQLPENIMSHDCMIWLGDLNYRIAMPDHEARTLIANEEWDLLLEKDQLKLEQNGGRVFDGWLEGRIYFPPTYKYNFNSDQYSGGNVKPGEKRRTPAWCDRILYLGKALREISYIRTESRLSDHRPVSAVFIAEVERLSKHKLKRAVTVDKPVHSIQSEDISPHLSSLRGLHKMPIEEERFPSLVDVSNSPTAKVTVSQSLKHKLRKELSLPSTCMKIGEVMEAGKVSPSISLSCNVTSCIQRVVCRTQKGQRSSRTDDIHRRNCDKESSSIKSQLPSELQ